MTGRDDGGAVATPAVDAVGAATGPVLDEARDWDAAATAVEGFFHPRSVAVVGASRRRATIGGELFHNLLSYGFTGAVLPINPHADSVQGVLAYPTVDAVPGPVDLAVVAVPADGVLEVVEQCERKGVGHVVIISAGFAEAGPEGVARQEELMRRCRASGMRVIGPNCMGVVNTHPDVRLSATFAPTTPAPGRLAFMSQSGALGLAIMDYSSRIGVGISTFVSVGNKADISGNDLIRYWARDPDVDVILLYLESFGNPRRFSRIAREVGRSKPIIAVKSGRSPAGARATGSHTGALISASDTTVDALFRNAGVIRTDTLEEMFDVASLLAHQPAPGGRRVAILTNAGGPGILCADALVAEGLDVPQLSERTRSELRGLLAPEASVENPVDMIASATPRHFRQAIRILGQDEDVDAIIVIFVPPLVEGAEEVAAAIVAGARELGRAKPMLSVFMQSRGVPASLKAEDVRVPSYAFPESAAIALSRVARYGEWLRRPEFDPAHFEDARRDDAAALVRRALERDGDGWLEPTAVGSLLRCYGLPMVEQRTCATPAEVASAAAGMGGNVVIKGVAAGLVHKTEAGAVQVDVPAARAGQVAEEMAERMRQGGHEPQGFALQRMAPAGHEMIVGAVHDAHFGPVLACGAGGTMVELLEDVSVRIAPLSEHEALSMVQELRTLPLLTGYRGSAPLDLDALVDVMLRVGALVDELPHVQELDLNPVLVHERGVSLVDARVRVGVPARSAIHGHR